MSSLTVASDAWTITRRNLIKIKRIPDLLIFTTIQPIMFVVLFVYVFGGAIDIPGVPYKEYLMAGIFAQTVVFGSSLTGVGLADDLQKGIIDRFRSLPMARSAVLLGRTTSDLVNNVLVVVIMAACALVVGWRTHSTAPRILAGFLLLLGFAYAFSFISAVIGLSVRTVEAAQSAGFIWLFPMTFLSNAFVATQGMPTVVRVIAEWNPISALVAGTRELFGNAIPYEKLHLAAPTAWPMRHPVLASLLWIVVILAVFVPWAVARYKKASTR